MAKLYRRQDGGYYTRTYMGALVTRQVHEEAVSYLKRRGVTDRDEIPPNLMEKLRNTPGWLFTKDEIAFGGPELPEHNTHRSNQPKSIDVFSSSTRAKKRKLTPEEELSKAEWELQNALDDLRKAIVESLEVDPEIVTFYREHRPDDSLNDANSVVTDWLIAHKAVVPHSEPPTHVHAQLLSANIEDDSHNSLAGRMKIWYEASANIPMWVLFILAVLLLITFSVIKDVL